MDESSADKSRKTFPDTHSVSDDSLDELRTLLLKPVRAQLDELQQRLDNPERHAKDISRVLPEAIALRSTKDKKLEICLEPITANAIQSSIKKDRQILVDALFPVMGPAIRKAIFAAIQGMTQTFNQLLEYSVSMRGLKWRLEALRTRKPFAEVVLLHTLVYQVEQVFLIHGKTGLVLQHVVAKTVAGQDPDLVSGMLTAIKDFVQDSFGAEDGEVLETLRIGERSIWIEQGKHALLAAVVRGNPPVDFQIILREAIEEIHFTQTNALESFDGDTAPFEAVGYTLGNCLQYQLKQEKKKTSVLVWILLAAAVLAACSWLFFTYRNHRMWGNYTDLLRAEPGIVVTSIEKRSGKHHISGMKDPLAPDPLQLLKTAGLDPNEVVFRWEPYYSWYPQYALKRVKEIIMPPESVTLDLNQGILYARGSALHRWLVETRKIIKTTPWIIDYRDENLTDIDQLLRPPHTVTLEIKGDQLHASGSADHRWLLDARKLAKKLAGINAWREDNLIDADRVSYDKIRAELQQIIILFKASSNVIMPGQEMAINNLIQKIQNLQTHAKQLDEKIHIEIVGHADSLGGENINAEISRLRAEKVYLVFMEEGMTSDFFRIIGMGSKDPVKDETHKHFRAFNRSVTFKVIASDAQR
ncbi:MAG: OmpA family protein [Desulfobacterales bacterium]|nr:OmpA family protein [Desulfobacterales bacterium]